MERRRSMSLDEGDTLAQSLLLIPFIRKLPESTVASIAQGLTLCIFTISSYFFIANPDRAALLERPTQSTGLGLIISGFAIIGIHTVLRLKGRGSVSKKDYIPLSEPNGQVREDSQVQTSRPAGPGRHLPLFLVALAIGLRVHVFEQVTRNIRCSTPGVEALLPVTLVLWECVQLYRTRAMRSVSEFPLQDLVPAGLLSIGSLLASRMAELPRSSMICPADSNIPAWTVLMQFCGVILDTWILQTVRDTIQSMRLANTLQMRNAPLFLGILYIFAAVVTLISGFLQAIIPSYRAILSNLSGAFLNDLLWASALFVPMSLCMVRFLAYGRPLDMVFLISLLVSCSNAIVGVRKLDLSLTPNAYYPTIPPLLLLLIGAIFYFTGPSGSNTPFRVQSKAFKNILYISTCLALVVILVSGLFGTREITRYSKHPIESLMNLAEDQHTRWQKQALHSQDLEGAVNEYIRRYNRRPPPGFDKWYKFATDRNTLVIDDFDTINDNLRLFWKIQPKDIRDRVKLLLSEPKRACAEVSIRSGEAKIGKVLDTHRWMVEGIIRMMNPFIKEIPDMDIAFNINDEPRVSVPFDTLQILEKFQMPKQQSDLQGDWSTDRAKGWDIDSFDGMPPLDMRVRSFKKIWQEYGASMCPPNSPARQVRIWDPSTLCTSCYTPHCEGPFLSNWTYAEDPCHQPDLALLHGFYLGPAAFEATQELIPIFSQSRAGGFSDILYPSAWNYNDKVKYEPNAEYPDPNYADKKNTLFWRGGSTEGFSGIGNWKLSARQRLVNAAHNSTLKAPVLLPSAKGFGYESMTVDQFVENSVIKPMKYSNDLAFVGEQFVRCDNGDCEAQELHFGLGKGTDFQYHWSNRYLLDSDGAGFSGRFLSFLQSHSLPIKTVVFREWWDSRVTPWKHFVPIDIRLHGLWSTMAYFATAGFGGGNGGKDPGEKIAEAGREWASKALRKEDMEIYFYRLLLEYGRLTDDNREFLAFTKYGDSGGPLV